MLMATSAWAEDMISLEDYIDRHEKLDTNNALSARLNLYYIYARCSAINFKVNALSKNPEKFKDSLAKPPLLEFEKFYVEAGVFLSYINKQAHEDNKKNLQDTVSGMIDEYTTISNNLYLKTGSYFTEMMEEDLALCNNLSELYEEGRLPPAVNSD